MLMRPFEARISNSLRRTKGVALHKKKACRGCIRFSPQLPEKMNLDERLIPFLHRVTGHSAKAACSVTTACLVLSLGTMFLAAMPPSCPLSAGSENFCVRISVVGNKAAAEDAVRISFCRAIGVRVSLSQFCQYLHRSKKKHRSANEGGNNDDGREAQTDEATTPSM